MQKWISILTFDKDSIKYKHYTIEIYKKIKMNIYSNIAYKR